MKQKTLGNYFTVEGKGLHTGIELSLKVNPAPAGYGIKIIRTDIEGRPEIPAIADLVSQTVRGTVLKSGDVQVSTIEHAMAALYAFQIDNCLLEVNGPEFPILNGSSEMYVRKIEEVGVVAQDAEKEILVINEEIEYISESGSVIRAYPSENQEFEVSIGFNSTVLEDQSAGLCGFENFSRDFAKARTFVFVRDIEPLLKMNLIKGGDLKNAIVIYDRLMSQDDLDKLTDKLHQTRIDATKPGYLSGELYFENEPARHKLIDLMGDIALVGKTVIGKIVAIHPGHKINTEFAKILREKYIKR
jgi:UDP-3-O-[3-hydroxymyristoyl] N-acetylglucosamine deacetylase/3-hydroxyacyl-[acyl-carrier-protein] dehydratase